MKNLEISELNDVYGCLLTENQRQMIELFYNLDCSLAEIAEKFNISRQCVHGTVRQAEESLRRYEEKLQIVGNMTSVVEMLTQMQENLGENSLAKGNVEEIKNKIRSYYGIIQQSK